MIEKSRPVSKFQPRVIPGGARGDTPPITSAPARAPKACAAQVQIRVDTTVDLELLQKRLIGLRDTIDAAIKSVRAGRQHKQDEEEVRGRVRYLMHHANNIACGPRRRPEKA